MSTPDGGKVVPFQPRGPETLPPSPEHPFGFVTEEGIRAIGRALGIDYSRKRGDVN